MKLKSPVFALIVLSILFATFFSCLNSVSALTGSIGNARAVLYPEVGFMGITIDRTILVKNVNNETINITLQVSEEIKGIIKLIDDSFMLEPGTEKKAAFQIILRRAGDYDGKINVFFSPIDGKGAGVALSSELIIHATKKGFWSDDDSTDDNSDNENNGNETTDDSGNGDNGNNNKTKIPGKAIVLGLSTLVLLIVFLILVVLYKKKLNNKKGVEIKTKKSARSYE